MSAPPVRLPREQVERMVRQVVRQGLAEHLADDSGAPAGGAYTPNLVVNISARHIHLAREHATKLFGEGTELSVYRWLYQPGEFASEQTVTLIGPRRRAIENVRVLGPLRRQTQVEISFTDAIALGLDVPVASSGKLDGTPGCILLGPAGVVELDRGVIRAERHVHMTPADAAAYGFDDGQLVRLGVDGRCPTVFERVRCRVGERFLLEVHLDTDEGNACDLVNATAVELLA